MNVSTACSVHHLGLQFFGLILLKLLQFVYHSYKHALLSLGLNSPLPVCIRITFMHLSYLKGYIYILLKDLSIPFEISVPGILILKMNK